MNLPSEIITFYNQGNEVDRLFKGLGRLEFARMQELLSRHLPPAPAKVADVGGGPGTYACWLAQCDYEVHLVEPIQLHVDQALRASSLQPDYPIASCRLGDARQLPLADGSMDAVLMHGPLYHLTERSDRLLALREAHRVLRPGGVLAAVTITAYSSTIVGLVHGWVWDAEYLAMIREEISTGQHRRPAQWQVLTTAFFHQPATIAEELGAAGLQHDTTLGVQGPGWLAPEFESDWDDPSKRAVLIDLARLLELEPVHSPHMLSVAHKAVGG